MRTMRYGEVLLIRLADDELVADVYNTFPLNDCPAELWDQLDAEKIAADAGAFAAVLNGPRYWLIDAVQKAPSDDQVQRDFAGLAMIRRASVHVGPLADAATPYVAHEVDRKTVFSFDAGHPVYELVDADGTAYVMQSWSQEVDPALVEADLPGLGGRLALPAGWTYRTRILDAPLQIDTTTTTAAVLQDDLKNSYSRI